MDCHIVREKVQQGVIHLLLVSLASQLADVFTKLLVSLSNPSSPSWDFRSYIVFNLIVNS